MHLPDHRPGRHDPDTGPEHARAPAGRGHRRPARQAPVSLLGMAGPGLVPADPARGAPAHRAAARSRHDAQHPGAADPHDAPAGHRTRHRPLVAAGPVESRGGHPDPVARSRADGPVCGAVRPDRHAVAAARPAVALQDRPGDRDAAVVDGAPPDRRGHRIRRVPAPPPARRAVAGRKPRPGPRPHARLPRPSAGPGACPRAPRRPAAVAGFGAAPGQRRRAVLPVHDRQQGSRSRRAGRARLAAARSPARPVLPARRASRQTPPRTRARGHRRRRHDPDHGRDRPARRTRQPRRARRRAGHADHDAGGTAGPAYQRDLPAGPRPPAAAAARPGQLAGSRGRPGTGGQAPLPADEDRRCPRHRPGGRRRRGDHPGAAGVGRPFLCRARGARQDTEIPVPGRADEPQRRPALPWRDTARPAQRARPPPRRPGLRRCPGRLQPHPPVPAHGRDKLAELRRADPRAATVYGASDPGYDHALRADPAVHRRG